MSFKRYIKKNGKLYGPYVYTTKRVDGKVVSSYVKPKNNSKKLVFSALIFLALFAIFFVGMHFISNATGRVTLQISQSENGAISGNLNLLLRNGELIPQDSIVRVSLNGESKEIPLSDLINMSVSNGSFYAEGSDLSGSGEGFGFAGEKISYPEVYFNLILSDILNNQTESNETTTNETVNEIINETSNETITQENNETQGSSGGGGSGAEVIAPSETTEEQVPTEIPTEQPTEQPVTETSTENPTETPEEQSTEQPIETSPQTSSEATGSETTNSETTGASSGSESSSSSSSGESSSSSSGGEGRGESSGGDGGGITGAVIGLGDESGSRDVEKVSKDSPFSYSLNGMHASVAEVHSDYENLSSSVLNLNEENDLLTITTNYSHSESGFGADFLTDNSNKLSIPIDSFGISGNGTLTIEVISENTTLASVTKEIGGNIINKTSGENKTLSILADIGQIQILRGANYTINLDDYFSADSYSAESVKNISLSVSGSQLTIRPDENFIGMRRAEVFAYIGNESVSQQFLIKVSDTSNIVTKQFSAVINKPVKWVKKIDLNSTNVSEISFELPKEAENITIKAGQEAQQALVETENASSGVLTGNVISTSSGQGWISRILSFFRLTGNAIDENIDLNNSITETADSKVVDVSQISEQTNETQIAVEYTTPAPLVNETNFSNGKRVVVYTEGEFNYTDILAYTELNNIVPIEKNSSIRLIWHASYEDAVKYGYIVLNNSETENTSENISEINQTETIVNNITNETDEVNNSEVINNLTESNENNLSEINLSDKLIENSSEQGLINNTENNSSDIENNISSGILTGNVVAEIEETNETLANETNSNLTNNLTNITSQNITYADVSVPFTPYDLDGDGKIDYIEWNVPHLSSQTYQLTMIGTSPLVSNISIEGSGVAHLKTIDRYNLNTGFNIVQGSSQAPYAFDDDNSAAYFDGLGSSINFSDSASLNLTQTVSWGAWFKTYTFTPTYQVIMSRAYGSGYYQNAYGLYLNAAGAVCARGNGTSNYYNFVSSSTITLGAWNNVICVLNSTGLFEYVNGVYVGTNSSALQPGYNTLANKFTIGSAVDFSYPFSGLIDNVILFNRSLTTAEISNFYNAGRKNSSYLTTDANFVDGWNFDDSSQLNAVSTSGLDNGAFGGGASYGFDKLGLVAYWPLDADKIGQFGNPWATGKVGNAVNFNGLTEWADIPTIGAMKSTNGSFSVWVYPASDTAMFIADSVSAGRFYVYRTTTNTQIQIHSGCVNATLPVLPSGSWTNIVVTWDGNSMYVYYNGTYKGGVIAAGVCNNTDMYSPLKLSRASSTWMNGTIDEVRFWNRTLSQTEITNMYGNESNGIADPNMDRTGLAGEWLLNESSGISFLDTSGNANTGTLTLARPVYDYTSNNYDATSSGNAYTSSGLLGDSLTLDGNGDYVTLPTNLVTLPNYTIMGWAKTTNANTLQHIFNKNAGDVAIYVQSNSSKCQIYNATTGYTATGGAVTSNQWYHYALVYDNSTITCYINGVAGTPVSVINGKTLTSPNRIGTRDASLYFWNGSIDDFMIFDTALNSTQISNIYNNQSARFVSSGSQTYKALNITSGYDSVNVSTTNYARNLGSNISLRIGAWDISKGYNNSDLNGNNGLVAYWHLDNFTNVSSNSVSGKVGNGIRTDNSYSQYIEIPSTMMTPSIPQGNAYTVSMWLYPTQASQQTIFDDKNNVEHELYRTVVGSLNLRFFNVTGSVWATVSTPSNVAPLNTWTHAVAVYNTTALLIYVNGALSASNTSISGYISRIFDDFIIGSKGSPGNYFNGSFDEVRVWNRSLSADEISNIYSNETAGVVDPNMNRTGLIVEWHLDNNTVSQPDSSNSGNVGNEVNFFTTNDSAGTNNLNLSGALNSSGFYGNAFSFNGKGTYLTPGTGMNIGTNNWSVSAWVNTNDITGPRTILDKRDSSYGIGYNLWLNGKIATWVVNNGSSAGQSSAQESSGLITSGMWHHIVGTLNRNDAVSGVRLYVDGVLVKTGAVKFLSTQDLTSANSVAIGRIGYTNSYSMNGTIDEVMVFNRTLSSTEIRELYTKGRANWTYTDYQNLTGNSADNVSTNQFSIPTTTTNIFPDFNLFAGTNNFYSPISAASVYLPINLTTLDTIAPLLAILYPTSGLNLTTATNIPFNFSVSDLDASKTCWYTNNSGATNTTISGCANTTINVSQGTSTVVLYVNDSSGNINSTSVSFYVDSIAPALVIATPTNNSNYNYQGAYVNASVNDAGGDTTGFVSEGLVSWWRMDDLNSSGGVVDYFGRNNCSVFGNAAQTAAGKFGEAFIFDGTGDYILAPGTQDTMDFGTTDFAISVWSYHTGSAVSEGVVSKGSGSSGAGWNVEVDGPSGTLTVKLKGSLADSGWISVSGGLNQWTHWIMNVNRTGNNVTLYKNGVLANSKDITGIGDLSNNYNLTIGARAGSTGTGVNGSIDDVMIFNRSLSSAEVLALYNSSANRILYNKTNLASGANNIGVYAQDIWGNVNATTLTVNYDTNLPSSTINLPTNNSNYNTNYAIVNATGNASSTSKNVSTFVNFDNSLVSWWRMDDLNSTGGVVDYMGRNNGSNVGAVQVDNGVFGKAMSFNGTGGITIPSNTGLNPPIVSISFWFNKKDSVYEYLPNKFGGSGTSLRQWFCTADSSAGKVSCDFRNSTDGAICSMTSTSYTQNIWNHVSLSFNGTTCSFYFNGNLVNSAANTSAYNYNTNQPIYVGKTYSAGQWFNGSIEDVMIFNRSLSAAEISALYANNSVKYYQNNFTGLSDGTHSITAYTQDNYGNVNSSTNVFTIDTTNPSLSITYPLNASYNYDISSLNYSTSDTNLQACWYSTNSGATNTTIACGTNVSGLTSAEGSNKWFVGANDSAGNVNWSSITFFKDTINPSVTITKNTSSVELGAGAINIIWSATDANLASTLFNVTYPNGTVLYSSTSATGNIDLASPTDLPVSGTYTINLWANDSSGNTNSTSTTFSVSDTTKPLVNFVSPTNDSGLTVNRDWFVVNVSASDSGSGLANITINLYDSNNNSLRSNTTLTSPNYINYTGLANGVYYYNATAYDSAGNANSTETRSITIQNSQAIAIDLSSALGQQVSWNLVSLPAASLAANGNNNGGATTYYVNYTTDWGFVDLYIKGSGDLQDAGNDVLGLGNETYSSSLTDSSVPSSTKTALTTNYADNKIADSVSTGAVYLKFFLSAPSAQPAGVYNNTIMFKAVPHGQAP